MVVCVSINYINNIFVVLIPDENQSRAEPVEPGEPVNRRAQRSNCVRQKTIAKRKGGGKSLEPLCTNTIV